MVWLRRVVAPGALVACLMCALTGAGVAHAAITSIGQPGIGNGKFQEAASVAVDSSGDLYVLDTYQGTLQKFSDTGAFISSISTVDGQPLPTDGEGSIAIDASNELFVADGSSVYELDESLAYVGTTIANLGSVQYPVIAAGAGDLYVLDGVGSYPSRQYQLQQYTLAGSPEVGTLAQSVVPTIGSGTGQLAAPYQNAAYEDNLAIDPSGNVWVSDASNRRVVEYSASLAPESGMLTGFAEFPTAIAADRVDGTTQFYVGDNNPVGGNSTVWHFNAAGTPVATVSVEDADGGLATDPSGNVFVGGRCFGCAVYRIDTTPDPTILASPSGGVETSQGANFSAQAETDLWTAQSYSWTISGPSGFTPVTGSQPNISELFTIPGTYTVALQATGSNGRTGSTSLSYAIGDSTASLSSSVSNLSGTALTGDAVAFTGHDSVASSGESGVDYSWDFDGSKSYSTDGGTSPTISHTFTQVGTYVVDLRVTLPGGVVNTVSETVTVTESTASITSAASGASGVTASGLTGQPVSFTGQDSAASSAESGVDYSWDFDGSKSYSTDGGTSPTISHTFTQAGTYVVDLRVTLPGGVVNTSSETVAIAPTPPSGNVGIVMDGGDYATNDPRVSVNLVWPAGATQAMISNDGGFGVTGDTQTLPLATSIPWTLLQTGQDRLPKTVYVRFLGAGQDAVNYTNSIILDEIPPPSPTGQVLTTSTRAANIRAVTASARKKPARRRWRVKLTARDTIAGICAVQVSHAKSGGTRISIRSCKRRGVARLARVLRVSMTSAPRYARVLNAAGSWSKWGKLKG